MDEVVVARNIKVLDATIYVPFKGGNRAFRAGPGVDPPGQVLLAGLVRRRKLLLAAEGAREFHKILQQSHSGW